MRIYIQIFGRRSIAASFQVSVYRDAKSCTAVLKTVGTVVHLIAWLGGLIKTSTCLLCGWLLVSTPTN